MPNLSERQDAFFQETLAYSPPAPVLDRKFRRPELTHPLTIYDTHLDRRLSLKSVKSIPSFVFNLSQAVDIALKKSSENEVGLPSDDVEFLSPYTSHALAPRTPAKDAKDIANRYRMAISRSATPIASMLLLHPTAKSWCTTLLMSAGNVSRPLQFYSLYEDFAPRFLEPYEQIAEKKYSMVAVDAWYAMNEDERRHLAEMRKRFPTMALWEFLVTSPEFENALKNMDRLATLEPFPEILPTAHVENRRDADTLLAPPPDAITTAWGTTVLSWVDKNSETKNESAAPVLVDPPIIRNTRSSKFDRTRTSKRGLEKGPIPSSSNTENGRKWHKVTVPDRSRNMFAVDEDMALSLVQHAWARAVERDCSFIVLHCGTFERIAFRHRESQTLFISDLIDVTNCKNPAYAHIHIGLYISIINDVRDRTHQLLAPPAKHTKRKRAEHVSDPSKRPRTRLSVALEEARKTENERNFKATCIAVVNRNMALLRFQHGHYNSLTPSSLVRVTPDAEAESKANYEPHEYFCITITSELAWGTTGDAHTASIDVLNSGGNIISCPDVVVKFAFTAVQKRRLRREFTVYTHLMEAGAHGIPHMFGLFEDIETKALGLVLENAGLSLFDSRLADQYQRTRITLSQSEKDGFVGVLESIHHAGVRHRDLRVENMTINRNGEPCIIDFDRSALNADEKSRELEMKRLKALLDGKFVDGGGISYVTPDPDVQPQRERDDGDGEGDPDDEGWEPEDP